MSADTIITDAVRDRRELRLGRSRTVSDCLFVEIHDLDDTDHPGRAVLLTPEAARVLFGRIGAFLHAWEEP